MGRCRRSSFVSAALQLKYRWEFSFKKGCDFETSPITNVRNGMAKNIQRSTNIKVSESRRNTMLTINSRSIFFRLCVRRWVNVCLFIFISRNQHKIAALSNPLHAYYHFGIESEWTNESDGCWSELYGRLWETFVLVSHKFEQKCTHHVALKPCIPAHIAENAWNVPACRCARKKKLPNIVEKSSQIRSLLWTPCISKGFECGVRTIFKRTNTHITWNTRKWGPIRI